jgi:acylphosphatase
VNRICVRGTVSGRVQGVGFRAYTRQAALKHGVAGWAKNLTDGRVEFLLCGADDKVHAVKEMIATGPKWSQVDNIDSIEIECTPQSGFEIS